MTTPDDDAALLAAFLGARTRAERDDAFRALVQRHERRVYGICHRYFGNATDAADATQETFTQLLRKADQFRGDSLFTTWLHRVATNVCNDIGRRRSRRPQSTGADATEILAREPDHAPGIEAQVEAMDLAEHVQQALLQLDELSRQLIILCAIEGMAYPEAARVFDLPVGTIKSRVFRARGRLAELLGPVVADAPSAPAATSLRAVPRTDGPPPPSPVRGPAPPRGPPES